MRFWRRWLGVLYPRPSLEDARAPSSRQPEEIEPPAPIPIPVEDHLDLHPFRPREVLDVVDSYLEAAVEAGVEEVRLIHGKGIGFQRDQIRRRLESDPRVARFSDAPVSRGHWGATIVRLRPAIKDS